MTVSTLINKAFKLTLITSLTSLSACQMPYLVSGAYEQVRILNSRKPLEKAIESVAMSDKTKEGLLFAKKAKKYASLKGLSCKNNFDTYVELGRPYISHLLIASKKTRIKPKTWWFPVVGSFPYKGFFSKEKALRASKKLEEKNYDTYTRGVTAYSSLGWFKEPILSSMLRHGKYNLAETIFHECFHTTFFIKNNTEANERLAVFFAHHYLINFLKSLDDTEQLKKEKLSWKDSKEFTVFLEKTINSATKYYDHHSDQEVLFSSIKESYEKELKPKLLQNNYDHVFLKDLNNAKLAAFKTYFHDFENLEKILSEKFKNNIFKYLEALKEQEPHNKKRDKKSELIF